mgnify:CR=1 FL=1
MRDLVYVIYKSMFGLPEKGAKIAHPLAKLFFILAIVFSYPFMTPLKLILYLFSTIGYSLFGNGKEWVKASLTLSSIVTLYIIVTTAIGWIIGFRTSPWSLWEIGLRSLYVSFSVMLCLSVISPIDLVNLLVCLKARRVSYFPLMTWRIIPTSMKFFTESLAVTSLKKEKISQRIPPATAAVLEAGRFIEEYNYARLATGLSSTLPQHRSWGHTAVIVIVGIFLTACSLFQMP